MHKHKNGSVYAFWVFQSNATSAPSKELEVDMYINISLALASVQQNPAVLEIAQFWQAQMI